MKNKLYKYIDDIRDDMVKMSDYIFDNPELGLEEYEASRIITDYLEENGFKVERGLAGMDTAFRAVYTNGNGGPSFGLLTEYDALENLGHACGHHAQSPAIIAAALALKNTIKDKNYQIVVYGTPAEETIGGKINMMKEGCFKDIDVALMMHLSPETCVDVKSMAFKKYEITFNGISSHAALKPELGRSALDALLLSFQAVEFLREHVIEDTRMHYTVLEAGGPANVVPAKAVGSFYIRSYNTDYLESVNDRFLDIIEGAALMTGTRADVNLVKEVKAKVPVIRLNDLVMENAEEVGAPDISPPREKTGSSDFGNVMYEVPGTCIRIKFVPKGTSSHSQTYLDYGKSSQAHDAIIYSAKIIAGACYDLLDDPNKLTEIKLEFEENLKDLKKF